MTKLNQLYNIITTLALEKSEMGIQQLIDIMNLSYKEFTCVETFEQVVRPCVKTIKKKIAELEATKNE